MLVYQRVVLFLSKHYTVHFFFSWTDLHRLAMSFYDLETKLAAFGIKIYDWWMSQGVTAEGGVDVLKGVVFL